MTGGDAGLAVRTEQHGDRTVLTVTGTMDYWTSDPLRIALESVLAGTGRPHVVLDLHLVEMVDSSGLALLIAADGWTRDRGGWLRVACASGQLRRAIGATNLDRRLRLYPTLATALDESGAE